MLLTEGKYVIRTDDPLEKLVNYRYSKMLQVKKRVVEK